ncbi:MAG: gamma-glutamylcyclotransferase (GGCT)/AIG2-like uncharacterized protein YtfP [Kiritimatiellia bacterium]
MANQYKAIFVYGALMDGDHEGRAAFVKDHAVRFVAPGVPILEPGFAALVAAPGQEAHGAVLTVDGPTWNKMLDIEDGYERIAVIAQVDGEDVPCQALMFPGATSSSPEFRPSARYMGRLVAGALRHGLPTDAVQQLRQRQTAGSKISANLVWLQRPVEKLVPYVGLTGAIIIVLITLFSLTTLLAAPIVIAFLAAL